MMVEEMYPELTEAMKAELDSRLERFYRGEGRCFSLEEAKFFWAKSGLMSKHEEEFNYTIKSKRALSKWTKL